MSRSKGVEEAPDEIRPHEPRLRRDAWGQAFRRYHHRVVVTLVASGVPADRAVDLAQAAWMRLIEQDDAGRLTEIRLPGLAVAQARLLALEARRRELLPPALEDEPSSTILIDPERQALHREEIEKALAVIAAAAPSAQAVFQLVYGEPLLSHAEAASRVGISVQRVRQILCELRKRIRSVLEEDE